MAYWRNHSIVSSLIAVMLFCLPGAFGQEAAKPSKESAQPGAAQGTDPLNAGSAIRISEIGSSNGEVRLKFETVLGKAYRLETAENPAGPWSTLAASIIGTGGTVRFADSAIQSQPKSFNRVRLLP